MKELTLRLTKCIFIVFNSKMVTRRWQLAAFFRLPASLFGHFYQHKFGLDPLISMEILFCFVLVTENILYLSD